MNCRPTSLQTLRHLCLPLHYDNAGNCWAYDDNAPYEEDGSRTKALAFVTACRILRRRLPLSAGRGPQSVTRESPVAEIAAAKAWIDAHPATTGSGSGRVR